MSSYVVGIKMTLDTADGVTPDEVTNLIEALIDALDDTGLVPSVSASGAGHEVELAIEVVVDGAEISALQTGISAITKAMTHAGIQMEDPTGVEPTLRILAPA